jgi:hypothetical protein
MKKYLNFIIIKNIIMRSCQADALEDNHGKRRKIERN